MSNNAIIISKEYTNGEVVNRMEDGVWKYPNKKTGELLKEGEYDTGHKIGKWQYHIGKASRNEEWRKYESKSYGIQLSYPATWKVIRDTTKAFLATSAESDYTVILSNLGTGSENALKDYLKLVYEVMSQDESFTSYSIKKVVFENNKEVFTGQLFTTIEGTESINFVFYVLDNSGNVLDITYRTSKEDLEYKEMLFNDFVYGIFSNGNKLFYADDYVKSDSNVILSELN